jgi:hypothetical protein
MPEPPEEVRAVLERARQDMPELGGEPSIIEQPTEPFTPVGGNGDPPDSLISELREQYRRAARQTTHVFELPGWEGRLGVRLRYVDERDRTRVVKVAMNNSEDPVALTRANIDLLVAGAVEVLARRADSEEWQPVVAGETLRFDQRLADALGLGECKRARDVVIALFHGPERAPWAVDRLSGDYGQWLRGEAPEVAETLQGESRRPGS